MKKPIAENKIVTRFNPSIEAGLSASQVNERINDRLSNKTIKHVSKTYLKIFFDNIFTFFNLLGLIVTISLIIVGAPIGDFFFAVIYLANICIGIVQEIRAKHSIDKLSIISSKTTKVIRDGEIKEISSNEIVLDDIIKLGIGNQIPTDCKILSGEIEVNEALLTGESVPVKKGVGDYIYAGSYITAGICVAIADKVGKDNYIEILQKKAKQYKEPRSELMSSLMIIIKAISFLIIPFIIALLCKQLIITAVRTTPVSTKDAIRATATSAIGMIPSGMMLLTSMALAVGIIKLARHKTWVKELYSLEMLARIDTICFDKTGTLTDGNMAVKEMICLKETLEENNSKIISSMLFALKDENQTANALKAHFGESEEFSATNVIHFNSTRKLSAVTFENGYTYAIGAPEFVLSQPAYEKIKEIINEQAQKGYRVLVLASSRESIENDIVPNDLSAIALILIVDNIREDAIETVKWFKENGVAIKIISGDNPITVSEVSKRVGVENADKYISLEGLTNEEVEKVANEYTVFGRVSPEQKAILVTAMKKAGHITAMTGDGVNDILALRASDCAISVASGSDAAKNVSHLVLMDNNFNSMPQVVYEGRRVINNVQNSASLFIMKTIFTMVINILTLFFFESYPFTLSNMIFLEMFIIGGPAFFLSLQPNDERVEGNFIKRVIEKSFPSAFLMILNVLAVSFFGDIAISQEYKTCAIVLITFSGLLSLFNICRPFNKFRSILFFTVFGIVFISILALLMNNVVSSLFDLASMYPFIKHWKELLLIGILIVINLPLYLFLQKFFSWLGKKQFIKPKK